MVKDLGNTLFSNSSEKVVIMWGYPSGTNIYGATKFVCKKVCNAKHQNLDSTWIDNFQCKSQSDIDMISTFKNMVVLFYNDKTHFVGLLNFHCKFL